MSARAPRLGVRMRRAAAALLLAAALAVPASAAERRAFVGYYPSWLAAEPDLASLSGAYTHVIIAFAKPDFAWDGASWAGTGLQFKTSPDDVKRAVKALHARHMRVLLAVGGETYLNWAPLAAEAHAPRPITDALAQIITDFEFDGLDVDYEVDGTAIAEYAGAIRAMKNAVTRAGRGGLLTLAAWSTGADCTEATGLEACGGRASVWQGRAGRERLLFREPGILDAISMISVMTYDAGTENFDAITAWKLYRALVPSRTIVNIGLTTAPEGWGNGTLVIENGDAQCAGSTVAFDQFGGKINRPYSVDRLVRSGPLSGRAHDGVMLWHVLNDPAVPGCGAASPRGIESKVRDLLSMRRIYSGGGHVD